MSVIGLAAAAAIVVVFVISAPAAPERPAPTSASNRAAAASDAKTLLSRLILPGGSTRLAAEPAGDHGQLALGSRPATPNLADVAGWWRAPGSVADVITFVKAHPPAGATVADTSNGSGPGYVSQGITFQWPPKRGVLSTRWLVVDAVSLSDGSTGVRADGESVWVTPRPASERIPPARRVRISVTRSDRFVQGPIVVRARREVGKLRALINRLPAAQPGVMSCPVDNGVRVQLEFFGSRPGASPLAQATIIVGGCGGVALKLRGREEPALGDPRGDVVDRIASIIGRKLKTR